MDYQRVYNEFIADRKAKEGYLIASGEYTEKHHILPRSLGGGDEAENLIALTAMDHFMAHYYLAKAHGGSQWGGVHALLTMDYKNKGRAEMRRQIEANPEKFAAIVAEAREAYAISTRGAGSGKANLTVYEWMNEHTGEVIIGTRHDITPEGKTAKQEVGDYLRGVCFTTQSGWFDTTRFASVKELKQARVDHQKNATDAAKLVNTGASNHNARAVLCICTGEVFQCISDAVRTYNLPNSAKFKIGEVCRGTRKKTAGYRWAYAA